MTYLATPVTSFTMFGLVALKQELPSYNLKKGCIGTILEIFDEESDNPAYEVDFIDEEGQTLAMVTLTPDQLWSLTTDHCKLIDTVTQDLKAIYTELDQAYPDNPALVGSQALDRIKTDPTLQQHILRVIHETEPDLGLAAIEAALDHPAARDIMAGIKGFLQA